MSASTWRVLSGYATYQRIPIRMISGGKCAPLKRIAIVLLPHDVPLVMEGDHTAKENLRQNLKLRFHCLPAHCGHHLSPIEGFWRVMKDAVGTGRCCAALHQLYQRTRQVLMAHQEPPIYEFHW